MPSHASPVDAGGLSHAETRAALRGAPVRVAAISLFVTACLLALKLTFGLLSGSIAVLSDAVDSGTDLVGGAAALISIQISRRPEDEEHPYGHGKVEGISASVAATIIGLGGGFVTYQAVHRLINGSPEIHVGIGLIAMSIAAVANLVMSIFMRREAKHAQSMALRAEATHLTTNIVQASAIIGGLLLVELTGERYFDPLTALVLAAYMAWVAYGLVRTALEEVMDEALPPQDMRVIQAVLAEHAGEIRGYHRLRTRRSGATRHIDMHLLFEASRTVHDVHEVSDRVSEDIHRRLPGSIVVIHVEPDEPALTSPG